MSINTRAIVLNTQKILHEHNAWRGAKRHADCHELAGLRDALNR